MNRPILALAAVAGLLSPGAVVCAGAYRDLPADLARAAADYDRAQVAGDGAELSRLLADDLVLVSSTGAVQDKAAFIADSTAPGSRIDPFIVDQPVQKVMGDVAILGGVSTLSGASGGARFSIRLRFADVWRKIDGRWQVTYIHVTRVPAP